MKTHLAVWGAQRLREEKALCGTAGELTPDRRRVDCVSCLMAWDELEMRGWVTLEDGQFWINERAYVWIEFSLQEWVSIGAEQRNRKLGYYGFCTTCGGFLGRGLNSPERLNHTHR